MRSSRSGSDSPAGRRAGTVPKRISLDLSADSHGPLLRALAAVPPYKIGAHLVYLATLGAIQLSGRHDQGLVPAGPAPAGQDAASAGADGAVPEMSQTELPAANDSSPADPAREQSSAAPPPAAPRRRKVGAALSSLVLDTQERQAGG